MNTSENDTITPTPRSLLVLEPEKADEFVPDKQGRALAILVGERKPKHDILSRWGLRVQCRGQDGYGRVNLR